MKIFKTSALAVIFLLLAAVCLNACGPVRNLTHPPATWQGESNFEIKRLVNDKAKKNVFIIADSKLTVLFDMLAPFYLFNATEKANVYIITKDKTPILIKRDLFVAPQLTFDEANAMQLQADVIVIPALSTRDEHQDTVIINWIKAHFTSTTKMLAVCDGASTAAATGLYDGKALTCHASDFAGLKKHFSKPDWIQDVAVANSGNLYSTAGVSNAVEGSLTVINELFGRETMQKVLASINYPGDEIKTVHTSVALRGSNIFTVVKKVMFRKNRNIGMLLENGINEFDMASILETYGRTFPSLFTTFNLNDSTIHTKYGLTLVTTGNATIKGLDELHLLMPSSLSKEAESNFKNAKIIRYDKMQKQYPVNICLKRIGEQYGNKFEEFVKVSMDYN
jgi:putative intracellular protease/amidase